MTMGHDGQIFKCVDNPVCTVMMTRKQWNRFFPSTKEILAGAKHPNVGTTTSRIHSFHVSVHFNHDRTKDMVKRARAVGAFKLQTDLVRAEIVGEYLPAQLALPTA